MTISFGGNEYCGHTFYGLTTDWNLNISYYCSDLPVEEKDPCYIINIEVCRQQENPSCCGSDNSSSLTYAQVEDCDTPQFDITLSD